MVEEWLSFLMDNAPDLYEQALASIKHQANWRDERIEELERLLPADGVHSCGPHCQRLGGVQRRRIEELEAANEALKQAANRRVACQERDKIKGKYESLVDGIDEVQEVHPSWGASKEFEDGWSECRKQFRALIQSSHSVKNNEN